MPERIRVMLVEDDPDLRESIAEWLELTGAEVTAVGSAAEFYQALARGSHDVAVVDVGLPDQSGYVLTGYIRANTDMATILLTARDSVEDRVMGYESGADLYLVKPVDSRELSAAIRSLSQRTSRRTSQRTRGAVAAPSPDWQLASGSWRLVAPGAVEISLTAKELQFLKLLAMTPGRPVPRDSLLNALYGRHDESSGRSLDSLVRRLRAKISAETHAEDPIKTAHAVGYCFAAPFVTR